MRSFYEKLRDMFLAGLIFLLPIVILVMLLSKVFQFLKNMAEKVASLSPAATVVGVPIVTLITLLIIFFVCLICGYLMRISMFKVMRNWLDDKLAATIPLYSTYREMALAKLAGEEAVVPYKTAAWIHLDKGQQPGFVIDNLPGGKLLVFVPQIGNVKCGNIYRLDPEQVELCPNAPIGEFLKRMENYGTGLALTVDPVTR